ncbi:hypothetical protein EB118_23625, partial [bacterium]|nr:hypothetical protein [bacterium]
MFNKIQRENEKQDLLRSLEVLKSLGNSSTTNLVQARVKEIDSWLHRFEELNSNYSQFMEYLLAENVSDVKTTQTSLYEHCKVLITAPCQVGKTNAIINVVRDCVASGISVVISSDNKKDQMSQLFRRLVKAVDTHEDVFRDCFITTVDNKNFENIVEKMEEEYSTFVICCLDNKTQIQKVYEKVDAIYRTPSATRKARVCIINDEGDTTTKARNVSEVVSSHPESHKKWIEFVNKTISNGMSIKRVFVSATPENVVYLHKPAYVWELPIPSTYVSNDKIHFTEQNEYDNKAVLKIIKREVGLRRREGGIILYCVERNKDENDESSGQINVFMNITKEMKFTGLDAVSVYNSDGIKVAFRLRRINTLFINKLEDLNIRYIDHVEYIQIKKNEMAI